MPFTPFHFGPGAALHALAPRHFSFLGFCAANVLIDVEPLYYMVSAQFPLHRFFHTYLGAALIPVATLLLFLGARSFARRFWLPDILGWQSLDAVPVLLGAVAGAYSHVLLDSIMHFDIRPFAPFSDANALLGIVSLDTLHVLCAASGVIAGVLIAARRRKS
jgi:membrane-bound metal-dependent hydrolase YbcI (DUF457 family)